MYGLGRFGALEPLRVDPTALPGFTLSIQLYPGLYINPDTQLLRCENEAQLIFNVELTERGSLL